MDCAQCTLLTCRSSHAVSSPNALQVTDGGWEDIVDRLMNTRGQLNLPLGLLFNSTAAPNMANWTVRSRSSQLLFLLLYCVVITVLCCCCRDLSVPFEMHCCSLLLQ